MREYQYLRVEVVLEVEADDEELAQLIVQKALDRLSDSIRVVKNTRSISPAPEYEVEF